MLSSAPYALCLSLIYIRLKDICFVSFDLKRKSDTLVYIEYLFTVLLMGVEV